MYKKTITYTDYNGTERTEDFYFSLSEAELTEMQLSVSGGYATFISNLVNSNDTAALANVFKDLIVKSYGVKSEDGRRFKKNPDLTEEFMETPAFSALYMELLTSETAASDFINKIIPSNLASRVEKIKNENPTVSNIPSKT